MGPFLHSDAAEIGKKLQEEKIVAFYHFTHISNLPGICRLQALCSKQTLEEKGLWPVPVPGGNDLSHSLDRNRGNWNRISLSLTPYTPMIYHLKRAQHLCFCVVDSAVATWSNVVFTDTNAASNGHRRGEGYAGLNLINFNAIRAFPRPGDREGWVKPVQAEILVGGSIAFEYISEIVFISKASKVYAERLCGAQEKFVVAPQIFLDSPSLSLQRTPGFPYVMEFVLTDIMDNENAIGSTTINRKHYSRRLTKEIKVVTTVNALAGTYAEVRWFPCNEVSRIQFPRTHMHKHSTKISLEKFPQGASYVEYYLNDQCWASESFEIEE